MVQIIGIKETSPNTWRVTYDGRVLGDSKGYSRVKALEEANKAVAQEHGEWEGATWRWINRELDETL